MAGCKSFSMPALTSARAHSSHGLQRSTCGSSTPGSMYSTPLPRKQRPGSGRFYSEELACFKRVPTPSPHFSWADWGIFSPGSSGDGLPRLVSSASSLVESLTSDDEADEGSPRNAPRPKRKPQMLAQEGPTARILDRIFPLGRHVPTPPLMSCKVSRPDSKKSTRSCSKASRRMPEGHSRTWTKGSTVPSIAEVGPFERQSSNSTSAAGDEVALKSSSSAIGKLQRFRQRMLDKFATVKGAFETFALHSDGGWESELGRKQFSRFLNDHFHGLSNEEQEGLFDFLDGDKNGSISMYEFHTAIEAAAPVKTVEDLRRKWVALGYQSMRGPVQAMGWIPENHPDTVVLSHQTKRLTFEEFSMALRRTGITDLEEHLALFVCINDKGDRHGTVSLDQLLAALACVSPPMLLEEMRDRVLKRYGSLEKGYEGINPEGAMGLLTRRQFCTFVEQQFGFSAHDAHKAFALIDIDGSGRISRTEFLSALRLVEPSLFLEEVRKKVRQRFRSIENAVKSATLAADLSMQEEEALRTTQAKDKKNRDHNINKRRQVTIVQAISSNTTNQNPAIPPHVEGDYAEVLKKVQFDESDIRHIISRIDVNGEKKVSPEEIKKGIGIFMPSSILQDLRLWIVSKYSSVKSAFDGLQSGVYGEILENEKGLEQVFKEIGVPLEIDAREVFPLIESRRRGGVFLDELVSALRSVSVGLQVPLGADQRDAKARQQVRWHLAPFRAAAGELRGALREPLEHNDELDKQFGPEQLEEERVRETVLWPPVRTSFYQIKSSTQRVVGQTTMERIHGYYTGASVRMSDDVPLITPGQYRAEQHHNANRHRRFLGKDAPLLAMNSGL